jgi:glycosyltransferase involved in cell wall biosynthesis
MLSDLRVTIVVADCNVPGDLRRCLTSLSSQSYRNVEILVVDDGASDGLRPIVEDCARNDPRIRWLRSEGRGLSSARMAGLKAAAGDYVCFVGAHEWFAASFAHDLLLACRRDRVPTARCFSVVHDEAEGSQRLAFPYGHLVGGVPMQRDGVIDSRDALLWTPGGGAQLYEREFLARNGIEYPGSGQVFADLAFHAQWVCFSKRAAVVAKHLHHYRGEAGGEDAADGERLFAAFDAFRYLENKLPARFLDSAEYFLLKFQAHDEALAKIDKRLIADYRKRTAFDLYFRPRARRSVRYIRALYKLKSKYGRRALKLYSYYLTMKTGEPDSAANCASHLLM